MIRCIDCEYWIRKPSADAKIQQHQREMAKLGYANCAIRSVSVGHHFAAIAQHDCDTFKSAGKDIVDGRIAYLRKQT